MADLECSTNELIIISITTASAANGRMLTAAVTQFATRRAFHGARLVTQQHVGVPVSPPFSITLCRALAFGPRRVKYSKCDSSRFLLAITNSGVSVCIQYSS